MQDKITVLEGRVDSVVKDVLSYLELSYKYIKASSETFVLVNRQASPIPAGNPETINKKEGKSNEQNL
jgi:hypothetical protein